MTKLLAALVAAVIAATLTLPVAAQTQPIRIEIFVYDDTNGNDEYDPGVDTPAAGVPVMFGYYGDSFSNPALMWHMTTDANGSAVLDTTLLGWWLTQQCNEWQIIEAHPEFGVYWQASHDECLPVYLPVVDK